MKESPNHNLQKIQNLKALLIRIDIILDKKKKKIRSHIYKQRHFIVIQSNFHSSISILFWYAVGSYFNFKMVLCHSLGDIQYQGRICAFDLKIFSMHKVWLVKLKENDWNFFHLMNSQPRKRSKYLVHQTCLKTKT